MSTTLLVVLLVVGLIAAVGFLVLLMGGSKGGRLMNREPSEAANLRSLVQAQRQQQSAEGGSTNTRRAKDNLALAAAADSQLSRKKLSAGSKVTIEKKLKFAQWKITPFQFRAIQVFVTILVFIPLRLHAATFLQVIGPFLTYMMVGGVLDWGVNKRFKAFDIDYPVLLLSYVSLLKTGMSTIAGLEAAAKGLDPESLVRAEVELLIERLRLGLTEEQAINAFGEDIAHPELELFVQSLLLSRKVGGTLSTTLERLAKQVRKRQQFRDQAKAVIGLERASIYAIAAIMSGLLIYLMVMSPELVFPAFKHELGQKIFQAGLGLILLGFWWSRQVTNIKV